MMKVNLADLFPEPYYKRKVQMAGGIKLEYSSLEGVRQMPFLFSLVSNGNPVIYLTELDKRLIHFLPNQ